MNKARVNILHLICKEIRNRKSNFLLSCFALFTAVTLYITFMTSAQAYRLETRRLMRNMGQNLRIIPKETGLDEFWTTGFSERTMPEEYVYKFASLKGFSYTHLTATLQQKVLWRDMKIILTGILPEVLPLDKRQQSPMMFSVEPGTVYIGDEVARRYNIVHGDDIDIDDRKFKVVNCLANSGSIDDIRIYGHLDDVQQLLNLPGHINEIKALECLCLLETGQTKADAFTLVQQQLTQILPDAQVILLQGIANIREKQRAVMEDYLQLLMLFIIIACGVWIGVLAMLNVKERVYEIGILRAIGHGSAKIAGLFVGKSIIVGVIGAIPGCFIGTVLALLLGPDIFKITARAIQADYALMLWVIAIAPVFTTISTFIPTLLAIGQDPALTLRND